MRIQIGTVVLGGVIAMGSLATPALAQTGTTVVGSAPGVAGAAQTAEVTATITAIDAKTREVTLKGPQGNELTLTAGPEVKNFAQMKVGDQVHVQYVEALTLELKKGSTAPVSRVDEDAAHAAKPGERPAGVVGRRVTIMAEVVGLDAAKQTVTLRGPKRSVVLDVKDPAQFALLAVGDRVEATYTEAVAISVEPARK
jgi:Cu/Ag efflux protein CusF